MDHRLRRGKAVAGLELFYIGIGGFLGSLARFLAAQWVSQKVQAKFPLGTTLVNITGSFALGLLASAWGKSLGPEVRLFLGTGFMGAYTTFSTFSLETVRLMEDGEWSQAGKYVLSNLLPGLMAAWLGFLLGR